MKYNQKPDKTSCLDVNIQLIKFILEFVDIGQARGPVISSTTSPDGPQADIVLDTSYAWEL